MDDHLQAMNIEEHQTTTKPVEKLQEVLLDDSNHERTTKIGTLASPAFRQELTAFLRSNRDVFAWIHEDMPGIDPSVIVHRLNVYYLNWLANVLMVKKASRKWRMCVDFTDLS